MVQIIQSGPSAATLRQQAMNDSLQGIMSGVTNYQKQEQDNAKNIRQQALEEMQLTNDFKKQGYDVTPEQISQSLKAPEQQGFLDRILGKEQVQQTPIDLYGKRTAEYMAAQEAKKADTIVENQIKQEDLRGKKNTNTEFEAMTPLKIEEKKLEIANSRDMSPIAKRAKLLEIQKVEGDIANQPYQQQKLIAETQKAQGEARALTSNPAASKLSKLGGESQGKVASIATGIKALSDMGTSMKKGLGPKYIDSSTPFIGEAISDNDFTGAQKILNEAFGRIQSGGAIGEQENKSFKAMGPRAGDTDAQKVKKLADQKAFLLNKLTAFGIKEEELSELGFDIGGQKSANQAAPEIMNQVKSMSRADKIKILQGGA